MASYTISSAGVLSIPTTFEQNYLFKIDLSKMLIVDDNAEVVFNVMLGETLLYTGAIFDKTIHESHRELFFNVPGRTQLYQDYKITHKNVIGELKVDVRHLPISWKTSIGEVNDQAIFLQSVTPFREIINKEGHIGKIYFKVTGENCSSVKCKLVKGNEVVMEFMGSPEETAEVNSEDIMEATHIQFNSGDCKKYSVKFVYPVLTY